MRAAFFSHDIQTATKSKMNPTAQNVIKNIGKGSTMPKALAAICS